MTRIRIVEHAQPGSRFAPDAWDHSIGTDVPFAVRGQHVGTARVLAATVSPDGLSVELTLELPPDVDLGGSPL